MSFYQYAAPDLNKFYQVFTINGHKPHPKSKFTPDEDKCLRMLVEKYGETDWNKISSHMVNRNPRQCRERWLNYLSPKVSNSPWSAEEDEMLKKLHEELGSKWVKISQYFENRTDTNIKNRWLVLQRQKKHAAYVNQLNQQAVSPPQVAQPAVEMELFESVNDEKRIENEVLRNPLEDNFFNFDHDNEVDMWSDMMSGISLQTEIFDSWM